MNLLKNYKHIWIIPIYGIFYIIAFVFLERSKTTPHMIHSVLDDYIPFCEYFIIPYMLWFIFIAATIIYFAFRCKNKKEYYQLIGVLGTGMTIFIIVSFIYPNGQDLRPTLTSNNIFTQAVRLLYYIDTPTNVLPSLHVFNATACAIAIFKNSECKNHRITMIGVGALTVLIILSTMFLKQHSCIDVGIAILLYTLCYQIFYKLIPQYEDKLSILFTKKELLTIPNLISMFRLILAILFLGIYQRYGGMSENREVLTGILIISGISDFLDGKIARKFHMVSEMGKLLDPIADKITQGVLLLCLFSEYKLIKWVFLLFLIKETYMAIMGAKTIIKTKKNDGAKWYGKISTIIFYVVMIILTFCQNIPLQIANRMIICSGGCILLAFIMYARQYYILQNNDYKFDTSASTPCVPHK